MTEQSTAIELPVHTYKDIMTLGPCYDPAERGLCDRTWRGTALDVLRDERVDAKDALWLILRENWIPASVLHEFACQCAERALARVDNPDPRSVAAVATKRAWLRGEVTDADLAAAWDAAWDAARVVARAATRTARATTHAAWAAAWAAAWDAAWATVGDSASDAAWDAGRTAGEAAEAAEHDQQRADLIALLKDAD